MQLYKSTNEIAQMAGCATSTARNWANKNNVSFVGTDKRKTYLWLKEDYERFLQRPKIGRPPKK